MIPILFIMISLLILSGGYFYVGYKLISTANFSSPMNIFLWSVLLVLLLSLYLPFILTRIGFQNRLLDFLLWVGYAGLGLMSFLIIFLLIKDITILSGFIYKKIASLFSKPEIVQVNDPERRKFLMNLINFGIIGAASTLTTYGIYQATKKPYTKRVFIPVKNYSDSLKEFTIVQVSDLHVGPTIKKNYVQLIVSEVLKINPDVFVFTGDLVDGSVENLRDDVEPLREIKPKYGKFFITGNHEYYSGAVEWMKYAENLGFTVLHNRNRIINYNGTPIMFAGVPDVQGIQFYEDHYSDPIEAIKNSEESSVKILLAHQPKSLYKAIEAGFDIQLSGHTHGGQFIPWNFIAKIGQPFIKGLNKLNNTWIYVSNGTGYWGPPLRIGARSEITVIKFKQEN